MGTRFWHDLPGAMCVARSETASASGLLSRNLIHNTQDTCVRRHAPRTRLCIFRDRIIDMRPYARDARGAHGLMHRAPSRVYYIYTRIRVTECRRCTARPHPRRWAAANGHGPRRRDARAIGIATSREHRRVRPPPLKSQSALPPPHIRSSSSNLRLPATGAGVPTDRESQNRPPALYACSIFPT